MTKLDDFLENAINDFNNCFDFYDLTNNYQYIKKIMSVLYSQLIDYNLMSNRGMWYYPFSYPEIYDDTTYEGVVNTLNRFKEMGINEIIIIPFKGKYCLYNSDYYHYYEELNNYNYSIYGNDYETEDGTCVRDYINVEDLAQAHLLALQYLDNGGDTNFFNLGTKEGNTVKEVFNLCENVCGKKIPVEIRARRDGDPASLVADNTKVLQHLNWNPTKDLEDSIATAYAWERHLNKNI